MTRKKVRVLIATAVVLVAAAVSGLVASTYGEASDGYSIAAGTPTPQGEFGTVSRQRLASLGPVQVFRLGTQSDRTYYKIKRADGQTCYAGATTGFPPTLLDIGCLRGNDEVPLPLIDMSGVVMDPSTGVVLRLARVEGVAANEVVLVGVEVGGRLAATTPVVNNVYRFGGNLPSGADAIVAINRAGAILWRKEVR